MKYRTKREIYLAREKDLVKKMDRFLALGIQIKKEYKALVAMRKKYD